MCFISLVIFCTSVFVGVLTVTVATHNVYHVQPDDVCKEQSSETCHTLQHFINNSRLFFTSNSIFAFAEGDFFHNQSDMIVQNVTNVSLIGTLNTSDPTSPVSIIRCLPDSHLHFFNAVNLLIKDLTFKGCSNSLGTFTQMSGFSYKQHTSMYFNNCTNLNVVNVLIYNPLVYAIVGYNVMGNSILENIIVTMATQDSVPNTSVPYTCSLGIHWSYHDSESNKEDVYVNIANLMFVYPDRADTKLCYDDRSVVEIVMNQLQANAFVSISDSNFSVITHDSILKININSSSYSRIDFYKCTVASSTLSHFIDFLYTSNFSYVTDQANHRARATVTFNETTFSGNTFASTTPKSMLQFVVSSKCLSLELNIVFNNMVYSRNGLALLTVTSDNHQSSISISTFGSFVACYNNFLYNSLISLSRGKINFNGITHFESNYATELISLTDAQLEFNGNTEIITTNVYALISLTNGQMYFTGNNNISLNIVYELIALKDGQMHFTGLTNFSNNHATEIIHSSSSILSFSNNTVFDGNDCDQLITLHDPAFSYMRLVRTAKLMFNNNSVRNEIIEVSIALNNPYPLCLFQYYLPKSSRVEDFHINLLFDNKSLIDAKLNKEIDSIKKLTSQCKWIRDAAFQNYTPFAVNNKTVHILSLKNNQTLSYQLSVHSVVCYCPHSLNYNCNINQLGPIYPGQNLSVDLCLPHNAEEIRILYAETRTDNMPGFNCKITNSDKVKHELHYNKTKTIYFTFASEQPMRECQLLLTVQPSLFVYYDTFNVGLLHCPLGFALTKGICGCDSQLSKYISDCKICHQTVRRLSNVYISGIESESSTHKYNISTICPVDYCQKRTTRINLRDPDAQCQPHRTGLLCSVCERSYSMVFGSRQCKKCSNWHLLFITFILLTGLLLVFLLFFLKSTVTTGTTNGIIFYVNIVYTNASYFHIQERLITPLSVYMSITNLRSCFEMCFYNGMDMYAKKWLQLVYPFYLMIIMLFFIIGSRYSSKLYRLTFNSALPVLATLFILTYTSMLQVIATLFFYAKIIAVPGNSITIVWVCDATLPLFGWKYLLLFIVCLVLFILLLTLTVVLLFTKSLMRFNVVSQFKPLIDAFQGSLKSQYSYWIGIQLLVRCAMTVLLALGRDLSITLSCIIILTMAIIHSRIQPDNNELNNLQELLLLYNYVVMCVVLILNESETLNVITVNVLVGLSFIQFVIIMVYHLLTFVTPFRKLKNKILNVWGIIVKNHCLRQEDRCIDTAVLEIPEIDFDYSDFREPLIGEY